MRHQRATNATAVADLTAVVVFCEKVSRVGTLATTARTIPHDSSLVAALCELAARVQRRRTIDGVLEAAGGGTMALGMRLVALQLSGHDLVLRHLATAPSRITAIEERVGRALVGLRARGLADWDLIREVVESRRPLYREDLDLFDRFLRRATEFDPTPLDATPETAGITNGVVVPLYVHERPWGVLSVVSTELTRRDADAVALFSTQVGSALEVAESIHALEQTNRELARAQSQLVERERLAALGELAAVVAHEVRNPLCVLLNSIASLERILRQRHEALDGVVRTDDGAAAPREEALLEIAREEARRLECLVSDLLDFARPHKLQMQLASVDELRELVAVTTAAAERGVRIVSEVADDIPSTRMDLRLMQQALLNVVLNAIHASPEDGLVTVRVFAEHAEDRSALCIGVSDTGPAIPADVRARMFEPFYTTRASGTGLGLAVVQRIMKSHDGATHVESNDRGTTIVLRLPVDEPP